MVISNSTDSKFLEILDGHLRKLEGGLLSIGEFSRDLISPEWEATIAENSSLLHLLWDIQGYLFEYIDFPDVIPETEVIQSIRREVDQFLNAQNAQADSKSVPSFMMMMDFNFDSTEGSESPTSSASNPTKTLTFNRVRELRDTVLKVQRSATMPKAQQVALQG